MPYVALLGIGAVVGWFLGSKTENIAVMAIAGGVVYLAVTHK